MAHCVSFRFLEGLKKRLSCDDRNDRSEAPEATSFDLGPGGTKEAPCWTVGRRTDPLDRPVGGKTHHVDLKNEQKEVHETKDFSQYSHCDFLEVLLATARPPLFVRCHDVRNLTISR